MRRNNRANQYTTEYIRFPSRPDLLKIIAEPAKTIYINLCAGWWASGEHTIKNPGDPMLRRLMKGGK